MNFKKLSLFLLPIVVAGAVIGSGYAIWQFAGNTPTQESDATVTVDIRQKGFSMVSVWFGEEDYSAVKNGLTPYATNEKIKLIQPKFTVNEYLATFSSPMKIRADLEDKESNYTSYSLYYKISTGETNSFFNTYFDLEVLDENFKAIGTTKTLTGKFNKIVEPSTQTAYIEPQLIYINTTYKNGKKPQSEDEMGKIVEAVNSTTSFVSIEFSLSLIE